MTFIFKVHIVFWIVIKSYFWKITGIVCRNGTSPKQQANVFISFLFLKERVCLYKSINVDLISLFSGQLGVNSSDSVKTRSLWEILYFCCSENKIFPLKLRSVFSYGFIVAAQSMFCQTKCFNDKHSYEDIKNRHFFNIDICNLQAFIWDICEWFDHVCHKFFDFLIAFLHVRDNLW